MTPDDYVAMQLRLECIGFDEDGRLIRIAGPDPDDLGRVYAYRHGDGFCLYVRADMPAALYRALQDLGAQAAFEDAAAVQAILAPDVPCDDVSQWRTYRLTSPDPGLRSGVITLTEAHQPLMDAYHPGTTLGKWPIYAVVTQDPGDVSAIRAACVSVRENDETAESYVYTDPAWRGRGLGRQVTAAWGAGVLARGKVPFYSYLMTNEASARLVQGLPSVYCFDSVVYN
ncbi:MAG: hypothetical protein MUF84_16700 [Anaerolineae bacterium]|jgi:GNAT superfamily N-acetyltransferase|nr:hypothetical protein [Anaerolineae bacterium]